MPLSLRTTALVAIAALYAALSPVHAADRCERLVATGDPAHPPYLWRDPQQPEKLLGVHADLLERLAKELGVSIELIPSSSRSKAQAEVVSGRADLLLGAPLSTAGLQSMDFVHPPLQSTPSVVWVRRDAAFAYAGWNDLRGRQGLLLKDAALGAQFETFARANLTLKQVGGLEEALDLLRRERADFLIFDRYSGSASIAAMGFADELQALDWPVASQNLHLALSHSSACNEPWLRGQLALKLTELAAAGVADGLLQINLQRWMQQLAPVVEIETPQE